MPKLEGLALREVRSNMVKTKGIITKQMINELELPLIIRNLIELKDNWETTMEVCNTPAFKMITRV